MATKEEIFEAIKERLSERGIETDGVTTESTLAGDLGLDSLDTVELTLGLEERFDIEIPDSDLENVETVGDAVELIEQKSSVGA